MTSTLPRPSRPSHGPPSMTLPALPVSKTRKSSVASVTSMSKQKLETPRSSFRSSSGAPMTSPASALPHSRGVAGVNAAGKTLRKTISINSFPQPPRGDNRSSSVPPSPLAPDKSRARKAKSQKDSAHSSYRMSTPSLLNGSGEGKSINSVRMSDGLISIASPPQSRSSSAQDSYSTSATTYEDLVEGLTSHPEASASGSTLEKRASKTEGKGNVLVSVRVRPDSKSQDPSLEGEWMVDGRKSLIAYRGKEGGDHYYDNVFTAHDNNARVYDHIAKRLVRRVMEGYHGTVFAYGMTGTGKTFSMQGTASSPGVIPLAITDIFSYIRETPTREFLLRVSYLEIYNEKIHDLLSMPTGSGVGGSAQQDEIKLREDSKRGIHATPLKEEIVQSPTQLLRVIARGDQARRTASTQFNARSSRSHAVVQIIVESRERTPGGLVSGTESKRCGILPGGVRVSTLSLIDLAGSERAAENKERRQEGAHINKSLLTLGTVIAKLSEWKDKAGDKEGKHLPYRDSKLTRLLQGALSGNSLVSILCTIQVGSSGSTASANNHMTETLNTLKFASRAKNNIVSHAKRAEEALGGGGDGGARALLERYRLEIVELRQQLETQVKRNSNSSHSDKMKDEEEEEERARKIEASERHEEQMLEMQLARSALKERIDHLNRLILSSKSIGVNSNGSMSSLGNYARYSHLSHTGSMRSSMATSNGTRPFLERTASMTSASSTIGRHSNIGRRISGEVGVPEGDEDSVGEYGDGTASLAAQNRALQADLADKNRYISTLEKRLLQARRASSSRTSVGFAAPNKGIMVGEDHSVAAALRERDAEIVELRARLEDKDRMLAALRSAARCRESADAMSEPRSPPPTATVTMGQTVTRAVGKRTQSVEEMNKILEEMIQDGVETGHIVRGVRGSVRLPNEEPRLALLAEPRNDELEPHSQSPVPAEKMTVLTV